MTREGPLKVARTFTENEPTKFGIYAKRVPGGPFNGELLALCDSEKDAKLFAASTEMLRYLKKVIEDGGRFESMSDYTSAEELIRSIEEDQ